MASFDVETYKVSIAASSSDTNNPRLYLESPDLSHGIRIRMWIHFTTAPSTYSAQSAIGIGWNIGALNFNGEYWHVWMSQSAFDDVYDLVRNESPIRVQYFSKDFPGAADTVKLPTSVRIGTDSELPGEAGADPDTEAAAVLVAAGVS